MTKKPDTWMPLYIGDYLADTSRLSTEQHGAYLLLLMDYWRNGPPLDDDDELAAITKLSVAAWRKHAPKIRGFFQSVDGRLTQKRGDEERQRAGLISSRRSQAGKAGASARWGKSNGEGNSSASGKQDAIRMANAMANASSEHWQIDGPSQSQITEDKGAHPDATTSRARADDAEALATSGQPLGNGTPYGLAALAMRQQGMSDAHPGDPRLRALVDAQVSIEEFQAVAREAVDKGKRFPWALAALANRRADAAANPIAAMPEADWRETRSSIVARAVALGMQTWEQVEAEDIRKGKTPSFTAYLRSVEAANARQRSPA